MESRGRGIAPCILAGERMAVRDTVRRAAVATVYHPSTVPVHPEWSNFALFGGFFLVGIGVIAYLLKLARTKAPATA